MNRSSPNEERTAASDQRSFCEANEEMRKEQALSIVGEGDTEMHDNNKTDTENNDANLEQASAMTAQKSVRFKGILHCLCFAVNLQHD